MRRFQHLPPLKGDELDRLRLLIADRNTPDRIRRRCLVIFYLVAGFSMCESAALAGMHTTNARRWIVRFRKNGIEGLQPCPRPSRPSLFQVSWEAEILKLVSLAPTDLGLKFRRWSLRKLEMYLRQQDGLDGLKDISRETIRQIILRHGLQLSFKA